jgi:hypothetical protein
MSGATEPWPKSCSNLLATVSTGRGSYPNRSAEAASKASRDSSCLELAPRCDAWKRRRQRLGCESCREALLRKRMCRRPPGTKEDHLPFQGPSSRIVAGNACRYFFRRDTIWRYRKTSWATAWNARSGRSRCLLDSDRLLNKVDRRATSWTWPETCAADYPADSTPGPL